MKILIAKNMAAIERSSWSVGLGQGGVVSTKKTPKYASIH